MNAMFAQAFDDPESYTSTPPCDDWAAAWLDNPNHIALLAKADDEPVGALAAYVLPKFEQARCEIYIYDIAVPEKARRQGVATALIEATRNIAREVGASTVFVQAELGDAPPTALYRKLACEEITALHFDIAPHNQP